MDLNKLGLKEEQLSKITNLEFKKEHLGALEFDLAVTDAEFEEKRVHFRLERVPAETFLKIGAIEEFYKVAPKTLESFVALPLEAKKLDYFNYDTDALNILITIITSFQATPSVFR